MTADIERMSEGDAAIVAAYAKEIFRFVTEAQMKTVMMIMRRLPAGRDPNGRLPVETGQSILRAVVARAEEGRLIPSAVSVAVDAELNRRGIKPPPTIDGATQQLRQQQRGWSDQERHWQTVDDWAMGLSDEQVADWTLYALTELPDPATREFFQKRNKTVRDSRPLRGLAFEKHREREAFK